MNPNSEIAGVGEASNGREAVSKTRDLRPDIVLTALNMPEMSGLEVTPLVGKGWAKKKIIALTVCDTKGKPGKGA